MTPLEQIKAEVIKCCPEIMELKAGCEVRIPIVHAVNSRSRGTYMIKHILLSIDGAKRNALVHRIGAKGNKKLLVDKNWEILGSPIELHHILRTMEKNNADYFIDMSGVFVKQNTTMDGDAPEYTDIKYNLSLPLASQSEPTLKAIAELLSKK